MFRFHFPGFVAADGWTVLLEMLMFSPGFVVWLNCDMLNSFVVESLFLLGGGG